MIAKNRTRREKEGGLTRRGFLKAALVIAAGGLAIKDHTEPEVREAVVEQVTHDEQPYWSRLPPELQPAFARFLEQTPEKQAEIVESIRKELEEEPLSRVYKAIIGGAEARQVTLDGLLQSGHAYERAVGQHEAQQQVGSNEMLYIYLRKIDAILVREPTPETELFVLLDKGLTRQEFLAHESLHHVQQHASPWLALYQFSFPDFVSPEGGAVFDQEAANRYAQQVMGRVTARPEEARQHFLAQHRERERIGNEQRYVREINAQFLEVDIPSPGRFQGLTDIHREEGFETLPPRHDIVPTLITTIEGYYFSQNTPWHEVELSTARFVGRHGDTIEQLVQAVRVLLLQDVRVEFGQRERFYNGRGNEYMGEKSRARDALRERARGIFLRQ